MTYAETIEFLFGIRLFGQKLGLETMQDLLRLLGHPERGLRFLHIAGTNGKGSVAAMCHAVLATAGHRTGLYTSPHLVSFCERFQVNGRPIAETDVIRLVAQLRAFMDRTQPRPPTFFEVVTALALLYFREQNVEYVVWETGLGGRLDATNIVHPLVSILTSISFDHMQYLGETLPEIAAEKCGIIKPGIPVVSAPQLPAAAAVIRAACQQTASSLTVTGIPARRWEDEHGHHLELPARGVVTIPLLGAHQAANCAVAVAALDAAGIALSPDQLRRGLAATHWPGRFQIVRRHPTVVLDGSHNPAAADILADSVRAHFPGQPVSLILGVLRDKDYPAVCRRLAPVARQIILVPVTSDRTSQPAELSPHCRQANPTAEITIAADLAAAYAAARHPVIIITGSLFLVAEAMPLFHVTAATTLRERTLQ